MADLIQKNKGLLIGILFFAISILSALTIFIPIVANYVVMILYLGIEWLAEHFLSDSSLYLFSGILTTLLFLGLVILLFKFVRTLLNEHYSKYKTISFGLITLYMLVLFVPLQNLGFLFLWASIQYKPDAQILFDSLVSFPVTGFVFLHLGGYIDYQLKKRTIDVYQ
ncbi:MAG: hypothetical protein E6Q37_03365 [Crocinitomicaceae bacterium]|nr:MAG: hypothetical protein E6Q37_03365 [Crocinitomicaceae bacterium]